MANLRSFFRKTPWSTSCPRVPEPENEEYLVLFRALHSMTAIGVIDKLNKFFEIVESECKHRADQGK